MPACDGGPVAAKDRESPCYTARMRTALLLAAILLVLAGAAATLAPTREIVTEIDIEAPPERVWAVLTDTAAYPHWNPFIVSVQGQIVEGGRLTTTMQPASGGRMTFRPILLKVTPDRELRWRGRLLLPRLFDGEHYFLLNPSPGGTRLVHGEIFQGVGLLAIDPEQFRADFEALNAALKARAEDR